MYFKKFSLITVCYDRWYHLQHVIKSWFVQDYPNIELIVVIGGEDDSPLQIVQSENFRGTVVRIRNASCYRPSYMRNVGAMVSQGEMLGFVDSDIELSRYWVSYCVKQLKHYDIVANENTLNEQDAGGCTGTQSIQRWLFERIHGYNENLDYAWGYEDTDLLIRAQRAGGKPTGYALSMIRHIRHNDDVRKRHFTNKQLIPRSPKIFMQHLDTCRHDAEVHPYEANRVRRLTFPSDEITKITK